MHFNVETIARRISDMDFSDITASRVVGEPELGPGNVGIIIHFDVEPTPAEAEKIKLRLTSPPGEESSVSKADKALADNASWRTNVLPGLITNADQIIAGTSSTAQAKELARAVKALARQVEDLTLQNDALIKLRRCE